MSGSVNRVTLIGNLGRDPEVRRMNSGDSVVSFSLATTDSWKDKSGERQERVTWHNIVVFNEGLGKVAEAYCKKGSKVYIEGQLQTRKYTDKDGNERQTTEIVLQRFRGELTLLDSKPSDGERQEREPAGRTYASRRNEGSGNASMRDQISDDIPFAPEFR